MSVTSRDDLEPRRESHEFQAVDFQDFLDNGEVGLHWLSADGTILWANRADAALVGCTPDEYIGRRIQDFHTDRTVIEDILRRLTQGETVHNAMFTLRGCDGAEHRVLMTSSPRLDEEGRFLHTRCFSQELKQPTAVEMRTGQRALDLLASVSRALVEAGADVGRVLDGIVREVAGALGDACILRLLTDDRAFLETRAFHHDSPSVAAVLAERGRGLLPAHEGLSGRVVSTGRAVREQTESTVLVEAYSDPRARQVVAELALGSVMIVPLTIEGRTVGTLGVGRKEGRPYTDGEQRLLETLADRVALALALHEQHAALGQSNEALRRTSEQLQMIADALPALVGYVRKDLRYGFANSAYEEWFGRTRGSIANLSMVELLGPMGFDAVRPYVDRVFAGETVTFEAMVPYRQAGTRYIRATYVPHRAGDGDVEGFVVLVNDMTAERQAAAERERLLRDEREARERLSVLARASDLLAQSLDYERTLQNVTALTLPALGDFGFFDIREGDEVRRIARAVDEDVEPLIRDTHWAPPGRGARINVCALSSGQSGYHPRVDEAWLALTGHPPEYVDLLRKLQVSSMITVPLSYQGDTLGGLTLFFGRSGRHHGPGDLALAEELARRAAAAIVNARLFKEAREAIGVRDDFLSMAGHELRTPLTALQLQILSIGKMVGQIDGADKIAPRAEKAGKNVLRLSNLVNELLDISRISAGRLRLERGQMELGDAVREVLARHTDELAKNGCEVRFSSLPAEGSWDRVRIEQIATNLLTNAIKYGKGKPIEVRVERDATSARLVVQDHGIGISPEDQLRIFQRFERAVSARHFGGLGLGLWIARQLVDAHGGTIRVTSSPNEGATFEVELPLWAPEEVQA